MKHLDLFSGIGGFALAAKWAGFETVQFVEKDSFCQKVLRKHWPDVPIHDDIKTFHYEHEHVKLLTGGFPCQGFSVAGKKRGVKDDRYLWPDMYRVIKECKPDYVLVENVMGFVEMALDNILDDLGSQYYATQSFIIPACAANAPHRRERVWIIANALNKRLYDGLNYWEPRYISKNQKWNMETLQSEWEKLKPEPWKTYTARDYFDFNTRVSRTDDGVSEKLDKDRIKALGNAIVPQVVYPIMKLIYGMEKE